MGTGSIRRTCGKRKNELMTKITPLSYIDARLKHTLMQLEHLRKTGQKEHDAYFDLMIVQLTDEVEALEQIKGVLKEKVVYDKVKMRTEEKKGYKVWYKQWDEITVEKDAGTTDYEYKFYLHASEIEKISDVNYTRVVTGDHLFNESFEFIAAVTNVEFIENNCLITAESPHRRIKFEPLEQGHKFQFIYFTERVKTTDQ